MFPRLLTAILALALLGSAVLELRRQRLEMLHAMAELHRKIDASRKTTWDTQHRIVEATRPDVLRERLERLGVEMEPVPGEFAPTPVLPPDPLGPRLADQRQP